MVALHGPSEVATAHYDGFASGQGIPEIGTVISQMDYMVTPRDGRALCPGE